MNAHLCRSLFGIALFLIVSDLCHAQTVEKLLDGYVGAGAVTMPKYVGSATDTTRALPLLMVDYREMFYIYLDRAGVRLWSTDDKKLGIGIAAEPRFGFHARDGPRLSGMATRRDRIEGGPSIEWETSAFSLSASYFTSWTRTSGGQSLRVTLLRQLADNDRWDVGLFAGFERDSAKTVQQYFAVRRDETTLERPYYQPGAATNTVAGLTGAYKPGNGYALLFGVNVTRLGAAAADSPIVARKHDATAYLGVGVVF